MIKRMVYPLFAVVLFYNKMSVIQIHILIFTTFFKIALFVVGGGLAMIPVIEDVFVKKQKLLTEDDILDMVTMTQTVPGLIAVNASLFVGYKLAGWKGCISAVIGLLIPSICIIMCIAAFFSLLSVQNQHWLTTFSCVRAGVTGIFIATACRLAKKIIQTKYDFCIVILFNIGLICQIKPAWIILAAIPVGWIYTFYQIKRKGESSK